MHSTVALNTANVDPETGFLSPPNHAANRFDAPRKIEFLKAADDHFHKTGNWPDMVSLCKVIGINPRTLENHLILDENFRAAWRNLRLKGKWKLESKMFEYAQQPRNFMDRMAWLRHEFPEEYSPEVKVSHTSDNSTVKSLITVSKNYVDAEIVDGKGISETVKENITDGEI